MNVWTVHQLCSRRIRFTDVSRIRETRRTQEDTTAGGVEYRRILKEPAGIGRIRRVRDREAPGSNPGPPTNSC
jgi:hypothetical protein